jgi:hypothetical protein
LHGCAILPDAMQFKVPRENVLVSPGNITFEINLYLILITAHVLLMFIIRTVRLLEISCCLSHLVCQLTLINIFLVLINYFTVKKI